MGLVGWFESRDAKQRKTHFQGLVAMAAMDGKIEDSEIQLLAIIGGRLGMSASEVQSILQGGGSTQLTLPDSQEDKAIMLIDMVAMMIIDGDIDEDEAEFAINVAGALGFDPGVIPDLIQKIVDAVKAGQQPDAVKSSLMGML